MDTLQLANQQAQDYVRVLRPEVEKVLTGLDQDFFLAGLNQYNVTVIADVDWGQKEEPDYSTFIPYSLFVTDITSAERLVTHYLHLMCHKKCEQFWKRTPVPRQEFLRGEIYFLEEIYNQCLFHWIAPDVYDCFYSVFVEYSKHRPFTYPAVRQQFNSLLTKTVDPAVPDYLQKLHTTLYQHNPLEPSVFHWYAKAFHLAIRHTDLRYLIQQYDSVKTL